VFSIILGTIGVSLVASGLIVLLLSLIIIRRTVAFGLLLLILGCVLFVAAVVLHLFSLMLVL